jgi:hypothetical protein
VAPERIEPEEACTDEMRDGGIIGRPKKIRPPALKVFVFYIFNKIELFSINFLRNFVNK